MNWRQRASLVLVTGIVLGLLSGALTRDTFANSSIEYTGPGMAGGSGVNSVTTGTGIVDTGTASDPILSLNGPFQAGGTLFSHYNTLNFVGGTVTRSGAVTTFTNNVSSSTGLTGDGAALTPLSLFMPVQIGGAAFADIHTLNLIGSEVTRSAGVLSVTTKVSVTGGGISGDGSAASPLNVAAAGTSIDIQQGGNAFASGVNVLNWVGSELSRSTNTLTVTTQFAELDPRAVGV